MNSDGMTALQEPGRLKPLKACDLCRQRKLKCDGSRPSCANCMTHRYTCSYTGSRKKRRPRSESKTDALKKSQAFNKYLEARLAQLESRLASITGHGTEREAGLSPGTSVDDRDGRPRVFWPDAGAENRQESIDPTSGASTTDSEIEGGHTAPQSPQGQGGVGKDAEYASFVTTTTERGEIRHIGSASGLSIFSPQGIKWVNKKTGDRSFEEILQKSAKRPNQMIYWRPERFDDLFVRRIFIPLPSKAVAQSLVTEYFAKFNCIYPLYDEPSFMHLLDREYSNDPHGSSGWWACLNVTLAIAHLLRVSSSPLPEEEDRKASQYVKNALSVLIELTMKNLDLASIQALLGIGLFLQGTPNPIPSAFLLSSAIRLSHSMGLHRRGVNPGMTPREVEHRKRVFWTAYILDKELCLRFGRPPIQDDDEIDIELPLDNPEHGIGNILLLDGTTVDFFRPMVTLGRIQNNVHKRLYSAKAEKQSGSDLLKAIANLDIELEGWKDAIPRDIRPTCEIRVKEAGSPKFMHIVALHLSYFNCLATIHRISAHYGNWSSRISRHAREKVKDEFNPRLRSSAELCVSAARSSIHLLELLPRGNAACVWPRLYYPFSAVVSLFSHILHDPHDPLAEADVELLHVAYDFISSMYTGEVSGAISYQLEVLTGFESIARRVVRQAREAKVNENYAEISGATPQKQQQQKQQQEHMLNDQHFVGISELHLHDPSSPSQLAFHEMAVPDIQMQDFYDSLRAGPYPDTFPQPTPLDLQLQDWEAPMMMGFGDLPGLFYPPMDMQNEFDFNNIY